MDKLQIAHDLSVAKLCAELPGSLDNPHICQRYFKYRAEFADLPDSHDEDYFLRLLHSYLCIAVSNHNLCICTWRPFLDIFNCFLIPQFWNVIPGIYIKVSFDIPVAFCKYFLPDLVVSIGFLAT